MKRWPVDSSNIKSLTGNGSIGVRFLTLGWGPAARSWSSPQGSAGWRAGRGRSAAWRFWPAAVASAGGSAGGSAGLGPACRGGASAGEGSARPRILIPPRPPWWTGASSGSPRCSRSLPGGGETASSGAWWKLVLACSLDSGHSVRIKEKSGVLRQCSITPPFKQMRVLWSYWRHPLQEPLPFTAAAVALISIQFLSGTAKERTHSKPAALMLLTSGDAQLLRRAYGMNEKKKHMTVNIWRCSMKLIALSK